MNDAYFVDKEGTSWHLHITFGDVMRVKKHVIGADEKPLDLCRIAETGDFRQVTDHLEVIVQCVYWLLRDSIRDCCDRYEYTYTMDWFYNRIDGNVLPELAKAWYEALINFTPFRVVKTAMQIARNEMTQEEIVEAINLLVGQLETSTSMPESFNLTHEDSLTANSSRWLNPV